MATFKKTMSGDSRYSVILTVTEKEVTSSDIANNSTRVDYKLEAKKNSGSGYYSNSAINPIKVTLDGTAIVNKKIAYDFTGSTPKTLTLASGTKTIPHEPDGTKTIECKGYFKDAANSLGNATASGNLTLTPLHTPPSITGYTITETNTVLTNIGVQNNEFVSNLSQKSIDIAVTYDDASLNYCCLYYEGLLHQRLTNPMNFNFATFPANLEKNTFDCAVYVEDTQGAYSYYSNATGSTQSKPTLDSYTLIPYIKPTFNSSTNAKRDGQLTGKVKLNITGTYYNGEIGSGANKIDQGGTYKPIIKYKFWKLGESQPSTYAYTIPDSSITISNGTFTISNYQIGSTTETATNYFNPSYSYRVKVYIQDTFKSSESPELSIPVGEAVWTEYKDRVDFKKLTIQGVEVTPGGGGAGDYENLINKPEINGVTLSGDKTASQLGFSSVATSGSYSDLSNKPTIPTKTSDLTNDNNFVSDASYVHTDNNYTSTEKTKLSGIASGAEVNVQSDWNQTTTTADDYIKNKPTIPTVNNGTLTIQKNGTNVQTFTANQSSNVTANITVPTKVSDLTNDSNFVSNTDYASTNDSGVIKGNINAFNVSEFGVPEPATISYSNYQSLPNSIFIGKGTLENVIAGKKLVDSSYHDSSKQDTLVSGTNIKTINNTSLLGSGNISITQPTKTSDLTNDSNFINESYLSDSLYYTSIYNVSQSGDEFEVVDYPFRYDVGHDAYISARSVMYRDTDDSWNKLDDTLDNKQDKLVSGTNIKTINGYSILGSGNLPISGGGTATDVQVNGTSITSGGVANLRTNGTYNASSNKIATMSDLPTVNNATLTIQKNGTTVNTFSANASSNVTANITVPTNTNELTNGAGFITSSYHDSSKQDKLVSGTNIKTINNTSLLSSGNMTLLTQDDIYYKAGDIIELGDNDVPGLYVANGYITGSTKNVIVTFSVPKRLDNISSITVNNLNVEARGASGYLNSQSGYVEYVGKSGYTITAWVSSSNSISIQIGKSSAFSNISNNTLVSIAGYIKFTLS